MTRRDNPLLAWHASPYDLPEGRFGEMRDVSGKGQGAASYGRGAAYVAENPKVSGPGESEYMREFRHHPVATAGTWRIWDKDESDWINANEIDDDLSLADPKILDEGVVPPDIYARQVISQYLRRHPDNSDALDDLYTDYHSGENTTLEDTLKYQYPDHHVRLMIDHIKQSKHPQDPTKSAFEFVKGTSGGPYSYRVALHLGPETLLDWDESLIDHHENAQNKFKTLIHPSEDEYGYLNAHKGHEFYRHLTTQLGSDFAATEALLKAGVHGIRYKDQGSRNLKDELHIGGKQYDDNDEFHQHIKIATGSANSRQYDDVKDWMNEHVAFMKKEADAGEIKPQAYEFWRDIRDRFVTEKPTLEMRQPRPTYNYVVFHPDFIDALEQYDIHGRRVKAFAPKGIKLKSVDHDPFEGEDR